MFFAWCPMVPILFSFKSPLSRQAGRRRASAALSPLLRGAVDGLVPTLYTPPKGGGKMGTKKPLPARLFSLVPTIVWAPELIDGNYKEFSGARKCLTVE